jgi:glycosyltransferase involved in cell wall biosynthesis
LKILQLIQKPQLRGAELFACQLSNHLVDQGHTVKMLSLMDGSATLPFKGELINLKRPPSKRLVDLKGWTELDRVIRNFKPDIVQANAGDTLKFAVTSRLFFRWNSKVIFRNANKVSDFITSWPKLVLNKFYVQQLDHVISVSELCRKDFVATYKFPEVKTTTVPIGIEQVTVQSGVPHDLTSVFSESKVAVSVASLVREKNHAALLRIVKKLADRNVRFKTLIIGDGKLRAELSAQIKTLNLENDVFLLGYRQDVLQIMKNAHVLAMPSLIEGLPGVILEAFYCGLPVVANDVGGISEVVNQKTGKLITKNDEAAFADALAMILSDQDLVSSLAHEAHQLVTHDFMNNTIAQRFLKTYQAVIDHG